MQQSNFRVGDYIMEKQKEHVIHCTPYGREYCSAQHESRKLVWNECAQPTIAQKYVYCIYIDGNFGIPSLAIHHKLGRYTYLHCFQSLGKDYKSLTIRPTNYRLDTLETFSVFFKHVFGRLWVVCFSFSSKFF